MKLKAAKHSSSIKAKLGLPAVLLACSFFFIAGFFLSSFLSQDASGLLPRPRLLESVNDDRAVMPNGESGDDSFTLIPFQVLSWWPRALYFPNFASAEHCESIIEMAKAGLQPSTLALRKGETAENTKGIRTSSGMFISASEDKTGVLDIVEEKIARATMLPRTHGEGSFKNYLRISSCFRHSTCCATRSGRGSFFLAVFIRRRGRWRDNVPV